MFKVNAVPLLLVVALGVVTGCAQASAPTAAPAALTTETASSVFDKVTAKASYDILTSGATTVYAALWFKVTGPTGKPSMEYSDKANENLKIVVGGKDWESGVFLGKNRTMYVKSADSRSLYAVGTFGPTAVPARDQAVTFTFAPGNKLKVKSSIRTGNDFPPVPERHVQLELTLKALPQAEKADVLLQTKVD